MDLSGVYKLPINLSDGGLGTTLEDIFHVDLKNTPLWSGRAIADEPETLVKVHLAFLQAGARTLLTSTYQSAYTTFERAGYSREDAAQLMRNSVKVAKEARKRFCSECKDVQPEDIHIALSLGTFGATLSPMQDFGGIYPPPYGPKAYSPTEENTNSFGDNEEGRERSIEALAQFHAERLLVFASDQETWDSIDCIAFETIPLLREVKAIREAMNVVARSTVGGTMIELKPWWITMVFPNGQCPEKRCLGGASFGVPELMQAALQEDENEAAEFLPVPSGIGINCTGLKFLPHLLSDFEEALSKIPAGESAEPWLILHPNGGDGYDPVSETWREPRADVAWAESVAQVINGTRKEKWGGIIVGGCCKSGPEEIRALQLAIGV
ncbi:Homocysteine S-methyltransferase [Leucogyrophana mollusca]|uniref:Homocysteine S-methyltransferase n=1 Tax=Leucogyrophana mollusca TaxID=85980 RepID=A0ACB8BM26_9AGAM|nr:Homocysteine S-methyltransferase [Leucogyrophana mollusca]